MKLNKVGIALIHSSESFERMAYLCPKALDNKKKGLPIFWTIGWGNTYYEDSSKVQKGDIITQERGDALFAFVITKMADQLRAKLGMTVLNENQFSAVLSFLYNVGPGGKAKDGLFVLKTGKPSTLWRLLINNPNDPLIGKEFVKWINKGTPFEDGLLIRRKKEVVLYYSPLK